MSNPSKNEMDVDAFLLWAEGRDGRWELRDGQPVMMAPERAAHALTKYTAQKVARSGNSPRGTALPHVSGWHDGEDHAAQRRSSRTRSWSARPPRDFNTMEIPNPVIVVEVLSPSTAADDHGMKLDGYFSVRSIEHYLIIDADRAHHDPPQARRAGAIETRILRDGVVRFDPPGFEAEVAGFFVAE